MKREETEKLEEKNTQKIGITKGELLFSSVELVEVRAVNLKCGPGLP